MGLGRIREMGTNSQRTGNKCSAQGLSHFLYERQVTRQGQSDEVEMTKANVNHFDPKVAARTLDGQKVPTP